MSKLTKLKSWLPMGEAAHYLSDKLNEHVSQADLIRLAIDNHIILSVRLINSTMSNQGRAVTADQAESIMSNQIEYPENYPFEINSDEAPYRVIISSQIEPGLYFKKEQFTFVKGMFDLRWGDGMSLVLRSEYQKLTDGAPIEDEYAVSIYLCASDDCVYQLLALDDDKDILECSSDDYYTANKLPIDSEICVRVENLNTFIDKTLGQTDNLNHINKNIHPRTEESYKRLVGALLSIIDGTSPIQNYANDAQLIKQLGNYYQGYEGFSKRGLEDRLPECRASLD